METNYYDMIVFCHLRWQFVYQRPQHLISRMSNLYKVLLVEEPIGFAEGQEFTAVFSEVNPHLHILQPRVSRMEDIGQVLQAYVSNETVPYGWFYSASFSTILNSRKFETVIYDCMDELTLFKGAPQSLINQENFLLQKADIVFTGGKSLFESKQKLHSNVFCFPSSVDENHFAKALNGISIPEDIRTIEGPIVGYFGVIDERIDLDLIRLTAETLPEISFVMIGPLAKIDENDLPHLPNIHYLGMKSYDVLPAYLKAFDIAMMPFALNDATKYISPTKTLEYMAAGKPIISTRIKDVERDYTHCVRIVDNVDDFCEAILNNLSVSFDGEGAYQEILANTSWDATANKMQNILKETVL
ncbi:glycosyltransferase involved in cell wall biosynthesis [Algoriphagus ratkowskyi]|uniref:Glycosyltransferase family 1 protein n=1 Tax=Algoriphagus ratkowskyi TaxID=57028 RepID=A0A2W7R5E3_9BACT|nr:glycosyltransferase [Algoriphagus ratkowskyi]PZX53520.1 glycosyltransferase involved in cell wall biosynthesis [Algoriphagus ratkowskyi]TXD76453.1 glycosyltransferase family 1 protein [Algoriphagus ratkowskyi]